MGAASGLDSLGEVLARPTGGLLSTAGGSPRNFMARCLCFGDSNVQPPEAVGQLGSSQQVLLTI